MLILKHGKTEAVSKLPNHLIVDLEQGAEFVECTKLDVVDILRKNPTSNPLSVLVELGKKLDDYYAKNGRYPYDYLVVDTTSALEEFARKFATILYKQTPIGKSFAGTDVVSELANGGGYDWLRKAFDGLLAPIENRCNKCFILVSHVKNSSINKMGKDLNARDLMLTGKLKNIVCAEADAIGYLFRNSQNMNQTILSFKTHEQDVVTGARPAHLSNQEFVILELENPDYITKKEPKRFKDAWYQIFVD